MLLNFNMSWHLIFPTKKLDMRLECNCQAQCLTKLIFISTTCLKLAKEYISLANTNCNLAVIDYNNQQLTQYKVAWQEIPNWTKNMCIIGDARVVKISTNGNLGDCRVTCIVVNCTGDYSGTCFKLSFSSSIKKPALCIDPSSWFMLCHSIHM